MPIVAIAGGSSIGLGRAITLGILNTYPAGEWTPLILSRSEKLPLWLQAVDPELRRVQLKVVDYTSTSDLAAALEGVHTLLSVTLAKDGTQAQLQIRLLDAAVAAGVKRFVPSEWANGPIANRNIELLDMLRQGVWEACDAAEREGKIECWAKFNNGGFMNYLGIGRYEEIKDKGAKLEEMRAGGGYAKGDDDACAGNDKEGDMADGTGAFMISVSTATAELPVGPNGEPVRSTMTEFRDIGKFVAKALELPQWKRDMNIAGHTVRLDEVVALAEAVTGKNFKVKKLPPDELKKQIADLPPEDFMKKMWLEIKLSHCQDAVGHSVLEPVVNELVPDVKPMSVPEYLQKYWA